MPLTKDQVKQGMDCIFVGGCANGVILEKIRMDAQYMLLKRPDYIKPVASALQSMPEVVHEDDTYEIHAISLTNTDTRKTAIFGIGVVEGKSLTWAFSELCKAHVEITTQRLVQAGLVSKQ